MPQSLSNIIVHIVFSTKNREDSIRVEDEERLYLYIVGVLQGLGCNALKIGGTANHVHIACILHRTLAVSKVVEKIKIASSRWIKTISQHYEQFAWQIGYGAFSVSQSQLGKLIAYIERQKEHHRENDFQEEYRIILKKHGLMHDERYVWD